MAYSSHYWAGFVEDDYRVSRKLTLNIGLRWDYESPITDRYNSLEAGFDPNAANPFAVPGMSLKSGLLFVTPGDRLPFHRDLNNWQPRLGLAYNVAPNTVIRAGYGASATQPVAWIVRPSFTLRVTSPYFPGIRYPRPINIDASIFKTFALYERLKLQLRLEAFNLTNTVWFGSPGTTVATSSFGVITPSQANDPRFAQVGARLMF